MAKKVNSGFLNLKSDVSQKAKNFIYLFKKLTLILNFTLFKNH